MSCIAFARYFWRSPWLRRFAEARVFSAIAVPLVFAVFLVLIAVWGSFVRRLRLRDISTSIALGEHIHGLRADERAEQRRDVDEHQPFIAPRQPRPREKAHGDPREQQPAVGGEYKFTTDNSEKLLGNQTK